MRTFIPIGTHEYLDMERDLGVFCMNMSILTRFILNQRKKAAFYKVDSLRYRGVAYKK